MVPLVVVSSLGLTAFASGVPLRTARPLTTATAASAPKMERTPAHVLAYCRKSHRLPLACPQQLPRMEAPSPHWAATLCLVHATGCEGLTWDDLNLVDAGDGVRPPVWSHVTIYAGDLGRAFQFRYPTQGRRIGNLDGLFAKTRTRAIFLGSYKWAGRSGTVVLAPSYPGGGEQGDHLIFRWRQSNVGYAVGLHGWEPLSHAFATLRAMVRSI
jgi:hypothetical protein